MTARLNLRMVGLCLASLLATTACASPTTTPSATGVPSGSAVSSAATTPAGSTPSTPSGSTSPAGSTTATTTGGACSIPANLQGHEIENLGTSAKKIALTFDGGATAAGVDKILATLKSKDAKASFFFTGVFAKTNTAQAKAIAATGLPVGNHSLDHPDMTTLSSAKAEAEVTDAAAAIEKATGVNPQPYFRFPLGARNAKLIKQVNGQCYVPIRWTVDSLGWMGTTGKGGTQKMSVAKVTDRVLNGATPGGIILMHLGNNPDDGTTLDADALPAIIDGLRAKGYDLVTLEQILPATP